MQETLTEYRAALEALAKLLIEKEVVDRDALTQLLAGATAQRTRTRRAGPGASVRLLGKPYSREELARGLREVLDRE